MSLHRVDRDGGGYGFGQTNLACFVEKLSFPTCHFFFLNLLHHKLIVFFASSSLDERETQVGVKCSYKINWGDIGQISLTMSSYTRGAHSLGLVHVDFQATNITKIIHYVHYQVYLQSISFTKQHYIVCKEEVGNFRTSPRDLDRVPETSIHFLLNV